MEILHILQKYFKLRNLRKKIDFLIIRMYNNFIGRKLFGLCHFNDSKYVIPKNIYKIFKGGI